MGLKGNGSPENLPDENSKKTKTCPICNQETKGLPFHIQREHNE